MTKTNKFSPNDLCHCKVGRNTIQVTLVAKDDSIKGGWLVRSTKTGKEMIIRDTSRLTLSKTSQYDHAQEAREEAKPKPALKPKQKNSLLDAAAEVLGWKLRPMSCPEIVETAIAHKLRTPGSGRTPSNTLYSSMIREIAKQGDASRFRRSEERGKFELAE